jgi:hypothetical protein
MLIMGESINGIIQKVGQAILDRNSGFLPVKFSLIPHTCGVSNVSMGLSGRKWINRTFLTKAIAAGLDTPLIDVRNQGLMSSLYASKILANQDPYCLEFLKAHREKKFYIDFLT